MERKPIILDQNFTLVPDGYQWTLKYESKRIEIDEDTLLGKVVTSSDQWYHGELRFALRAYCDKVLKPEPSVKALWDKIEELVVKIDNLFASKDIPAVAEKKSRKPRAEATRDEIIESLITDPDPVDPYASPDSFPDSFIDPDLY